MGTTVRLIAPPEAPLGAVRQGIEALAARLSRFDARSELCALNADPRPVAPASRVLRRAVAAALLVYVLSVVHTLGAGTDAGAAWLPWAMAGTGAPILYLLVVRMLPAPAPQRARRTRTGTSAVPGAS